MTFPTLMLVPVIVTALLLPSIALFLHYTHK